jgi:hypothetical protein
MIGEPRETTPMNQTTPPHGEPVARESANLVADRLRQLQALFPDAASEGRLDFDKLRAALGEAVAAGAERFSFGWAGRADAVALLQTPSRATLVPCPRSRSPSTRRATCSSRATTWRCSSCSTRRTPAR